MPLMLDPTGLYFLSGFARRGRRHQTLFVPTRNFAFQVQVMELCFYGMRAGNVSENVSSTGRTHRATAAIMMPGTRGEPVRSIRSWET